MRSAERGVILIFVGLTLAVLVAVSVFVVDLGVLWLARAQAQNAADAGALAGATALAYDDATDLSPTGPAYVSASTLAGANTVFGGTHGVEVFVDPSLTWDPAPPAICAGGGCVQVSVYQDGTHQSSTLPTYFAKMFGIGSQGVKATATAQVASANATGCLRPWFLPDLYVDSNGNGLYDPGEYNPPSIGGYTDSNIGDPAVFHPNTAPGAYGQIDVGSGVAEIRDAIGHCAPGDGVAIGETLATKPGASNGQKSGIDDLLSWDPDAAWNPSTGLVEGGCAAAGTCACPDTPDQCPYGGTQSPRIMQIAVCDPSEISCRGDKSPSGPSGTITVVKIVSFFIDGYTFNAGDLLINATFISSTGEVRSGPASPPGATFLVSIRLVR